MRVAGVDVGTNTLRMLIADVENGKIKPLRRERIVTRLGDSFVLTGYLKEEAIERSIKALEVFKRIADDEGCQKVVVIATSCVRESRNGRVFVRMVKERINWDVTVVDGNKEAYLTYLGAKVGLDIKGVTVIFDIGGGSTEYIRSDGSFKVKSVNMGVVKLKDLFMKEDPPSKEEIDNMDRYIRKVIEEELTGFMEGDCEFLVGTAGTVTTIAAIKLSLEKYDPEVIHGTSVNRNEVENIFERLVKMNPKERLKLPGMEVGREDLIIPGIMVTVATMDYFGKDELVVSEWGILEGMVYYYAGCDR